MKNPTVMFTAPCQVAIEDEPVPMPDGRKVLIETELTLVSTGTELTVLAGESNMGTVWSAGCHFPCKSGYCNVGIVRETGPDADRELLGKRVQSYGGHARYVVQSTELARPVPDPVPSEHAVFATMAEIAFHGVRRAGVRMGSSAVVYGLGLLGQLSVRFARLCGARPVLGVDPSDMRIGMLPKHPSVIGVNPKSQSVPDTVKQATRGRMADIAIELTGVPSLIPEQIPVLRRQGTLAIVSGPRGKTQIDFHDLCVVPSVRIVGIHNGSHPAIETPDDPWTKNRDVELFFDLLADGDMDVAPLISHRASYQEAPALYQTLLSDRTQAMGVIFDWTK